MTRPCDGTSPTRRDFFGRVWRLLGWVAAAEAALRRALGPEPSNGDFLFALADLLLRQGKTAQAREVLRVWIER